MKTGWMKKIGFGLMLTLALGTSACGVGGGQDIDDSEAGQNTVQQENSARNDGATDERSNGNVNNDGNANESDDFISVTGNDGSTFTCEGGECNLFPPSFDSGDF